MIALLLPWAVFTANAKFFHGKYKFISVITGIFLVYTVLLIQVHFIDVRLEKELYAFDLNGDGVFSGTEINPAQELAMKEWANDTALAMAPITGAIFSVLYTSITLIIWFSTSWLWSKYRAYITLRSSGSPQKRVDP